MSKIVASLLLVLLLSVYANAQQRQAGNYGKEASQRQAPAQSAAPLNPRTSSAPSEPRTNGNERDASQLWPKFTERLIDPVTWFTGLLFLVGIWQWRAMKAGLAETRRSNVATEFSNEIAERAFLMGNRPWIVPRIDDPTSVGAAGVIVKLENSGRSPAVMVREGHSFVLFEGDVPEAIAIPPADYTDTAAILPPAAQGYNVTLLVRPLAAEDWAKIQAGSKRMLLCYHILYRDLAEQAWETKIAWWRSTNGRWLIANKLCEIK